MTDIQSIGEDRRFVRNAVAKLQRSDRAWGKVRIIWAVYVVIGYTLYIYRRFMGPVLAE